MDGPQVLGGAPFNVAWNLQAFGRKPLFVSAVGDDRLGDSIRQQMLSHAMSIAGLQSNKKSTGVVKVAFVDGEPNYEIVTDQAYDHIEFNPDTFADREVSLIYHGSLAWRSPGTRATIQSVRKTLDAPVFVDLNIRPPWFEREWLPEMLTGIHSLKLNADELKELSGETATGFVDASDGESRIDQIKHVAFALLKKFSLQRVWVTDGSFGAAFVERDGGSGFSKSVQVEGFADTIGAGDAFSSVVIDGFVSGLATNQVLDNAVKFAAKVCSLRGATTDNLDFYQGH